MIDQVKLTPLSVIGSPRGAEGLKAPCLKFAALVAFEEVLIANLSFESCKEQDDNKRSPGRFLYLRPMM